MRIRTELNLRSLRARINVIHRKANGLENLSGTDVAEATQIKKDVDRALAWKERVFKSSEKDYVANDPILMSREEEYEKYKELRDSYDEMAKLVLENQDRVLPLMEYRALREALH